MEERKRRTGPGSRLNRCPVCGNAFYVSGAGWGYAVGAEYQCSYKCMRERELQVMKKSEKVKIYKMADGGMDPAYIAAELGLSERQVKYILTWRKKELEGAEIAPEGDGGAAEADDGETAADDGQTAVGQAAVGQAAVGQAVKADAEQEWEFKGWKALGTLETLVKMDMSDDDLDMALEALGRIEAALRIRAVR